MLKNFFIKCFLFDVVYIIIFVGLVVRLFFKIIFKVLKVLLFFLKERLLIKIINFCGIFCNFFKINGKFFRLDLVILIKWRLC